LESGELQYEYQCGEEVRCAGWNLESYSMSINVVRLINPSKLYPSILNEADEVGTTGEVGVVVGGGARQ
jgi:hypothetical protein